MEFAVRLEGITKRYPRKAGYRDMVKFWKPRQFLTALNGVTLEVPQGSTFGILGSNGAGKTTLLKVLAGLVLADEGFVEINGEDVTRAPERTRHSLMYVSVEERSHYWRLTGRQNLQFFAMMNGIPRRDRTAHVDRLLEIVGLEPDQADELVMRYSTGMRQRLAIARGLLSNPDILLLDEPTRSMDPVGARHLWEFIKADLIQRMGKTILIATHNMEEAAFLCDRVAIVNRGYIERCDTVHSMTRALTGRGHYSITVGRSSLMAVERLSELRGVTDLSVLPSSNGHIEFTIIVDDEEQNIPEVVDTLVSLGGQILAVEPRTNSLSDVIAELAKSKN